MTESATPTPRAPRQWRAGELALVVLAVIGTIVALKWAAPLLIPLTAGMLIAYALRPLVEGLQRIRIPRAASAMLVMAAVSALIVGAGALVKDDAIAALAELPQAARKLRLAAQENARAPNNPVGHVREAAAELNRAAAEAVGAPATPPPASTAPASRAAAATPPPAAAPPAAPGDATSWASLQSSKFVDTLSELGVAALFALFILASGDTFRLKAVRLAGPRLASRRITVEILDEIDNQVQRYLLVMLITNLVIAFAIWGALAVFGLERAAMWGATAGVLHVIPYVGSLLTTIVIAIAAFLQFGTLASAAGAAVVVFAVSAVIGMGFMSWLHGRATQLNAVAVFVSLVFFGWLWGGWGLLLGAPLASILKTIADRVPALDGVGELLGR
jgi:predicted PurR-regulated permease PerM